MKCLLWKYIIKIRKVIKIISDINRAVFPEIKKIVIYTHSEK